MNEKIVYKIFTVADYEREERYLRKMHQAGWKLTKVSFSIFIVAVKYTFESCLAEDMVYQLDFQPLKKADRVAYFQLFKDFGWEHVQDFNDFAYFRKPISEIDSDEEFEIYNDAESKLDMIKRIVTWRFLPALLVLLGTLIYLGNQSLTRFPILLVILCFLFFIPLLQLLHIGRIFLKKRKELLENKN